MTIIIQRAPGLKLPVPSRLPFRPFIRTTGPSSAHLRPMTRGLPHPDRHQTTPPSDRRGLTLGC
ncbi:hypothetical protein B0T26DRAFT_721099 [Lasiosphaeria miniovina]|uniref:Uncharacterized protein n=1 Tax=Lasiosphaeria miniovina TaxID=1954250 RepID=A0AA40DQA2_9PEZI|nr:uncharacterized protein B0T26DRAFT_721099 [Lasiosphaeria miniovina]KAK0709297.1 hypothetical protein B0T26DRAFT_721099 [Lasiosphaeria miniovina]